MVPATQQTYFLSIETRALIWNSELNKTHVHDFASTCQSHGYVYVFHKSSHSSNCVFFIRLRLCVGLGLDIARARRTLRPRSGKFQNSDVLFQTFWFHFCWALEQPSFLASANSKAIFTAFFRSETLFYFIVTAPFHLSALVSTNLTSARVWQLRYCSRIRAVCCVFWLSHGCVCRTPSAVFTGLGAQ